VSWRRREAGAHRSVAPVATVATGAPGAPGAPGTRPRRAAGGETANQGATAGQYETAKQDENAGAEAGDKQTGPERGGRWPETVGAPDGSPVAAATNGYGRRAGRDKLGRDKVSGDKARRDKVSGDNAGREKVGGVGRDKLGRVGREKVGGLGRDKLGRDKRKMSIGGLSRTARKPEPSVDDQQLVQAGAPAGSGSRSQRIANSRTKHPSASVALARARPPTEAAGWYNDPTDSQNRRIRYWDGSSWTSHVAEPEI
jgi:hypothetical protein